MLGDWQSGKLGYINVRPASIENPQELSVLRPFERSDDGSLLATIVETPCLAIEMQVHDGGPDSDTPWKLVMQQCNRRMLLW